MEVISSIYNSGYNIKKFYLGSRELNLAYLGNQVIYDEVIGDNDLNYILYEFYGSDTLPNTVEAPVKSAILKSPAMPIKFGDIFQTSLVTKFIFSTGKYLNVANGGWSSGTSTHYYSEEFYSIPPNSKKLTIKGNNNYKKVCFYDVSKTFISGVNHSTQDTTDLVCDIPQNAEYYRFNMAITSANDSYLDVFIDSELCASNKEYENQLATTKAPILKFIGKNMFDGEIEEGVFDTNTGQPTAQEARTRSKNFIPVPEDTDLYITIQNGNGSSWTSIYAYDKNKQYIECLVSSAQGNKTFNTKKARYIKFKTNHSIDKVGNIQIELGKIGTAYEDYKASILSCNEYLELGRLGDVYDELDYLRGRFVQRTGIRAYEAGDEDNSEVVTDLLNTRFKLDTAITKKVDLTIINQNNQTISILNSFNGTTHVSTEVAENSAYPMVSLEVASELQAAMSKVAEDIELIKPVQNDIETTIDTQSNDIDSLLLATTELFEMFL